MRESKAGSAKRRKAVWIAGISFGLILVICCLSIGFFYTSHIRADHFNIGTYSDYIKSTFYLYENKIYAPVSVNVHGTIVLEEIPEYIGVPISSASDMVFAKSFSGYTMKGNMIGHAEGDFLNDTQEKMNQVCFYEILDQQKQPVSGLLWAETEDGKDSLVVEISEPYSGKTRHLNKWEEYALDVVILTEARSGIEWSRQFGSYPGGSKYFKNIKEDLSYKFRRNWAFFYFDIFR